MNSFANYDNVESLLIDVSCEINKQNLKEFVYTSLSLNNIPLSSKKKVSAFYLNSVNQYQIIIYDKKYKFVFFEIFSLYVNKKVKDEEYVLFLNKNFIVIFFGQKFYYFQKFEYKIDFNDLTEYFYKKLNIKIDKVYKFDCGSVENLKKEYIKKTKISIFKNLNEKRVYFNYFYVLYLLTLCALLFYYYENSVFQYNKKIKQDKQNKENELLIQKQKYTYKPFYDELNYVLLQSKNNNLKIQNFSYTQKNLSLVFNSKDKQNIYLFLNSFRSRLISNSIEYNESLKLYKCIISIHLNR